MEEAVSARELLWLFSSSFGAGWEDVLMPEDR